MEFCGWLGGVFDRTGEIHILHCEVAAGEDGKELLQQMSKATRRSVRGSSKKHGAGVDIQDGYYWRLSKRAEDGEMRLSEASAEGVSCGHPDAASIYFDETKLMAW